MKWLIAIGTVVVVMTTMLALAPDLGEYAVNRGSINSVVRP